MSGTKRVLVALDATLQNPGLLEAAADLAHRRMAEGEVGGYRQHLRVPLDRPDGRRERRAVDD